MSSSWVSSWVTHEIQNSSWGFSWGIFVPHRFPHEDFSSSWVSSWGIAFHEEIGPLPHEVLMRKPIFHEDFMRLSPRGTWFLMSTSWGLLWVIFFFTRKLAHFLMSCSWGFFHEELWFLNCDCEVLHEENFWRGKWPGHFLMRTSMRSSWGFFHEEIESQFHMIEFPLEFPQWASCPHPNLSFIPRETLMNTFLSHESFHEEQTEQQMRNLHHKYMYGWNKI